MYRKDRYKGDKEARMQIEIDPASEVPLYQQLRERIVEAIAGGGLHPGDRLEPVRRLAGQFGINIATVGRAYDLLRAEGLVRTNRAAGTVIARGPGTTPAGWERSARADWNARLGVVIAEAIAQGESDEVVLADVRDALERLAAQRAAHENIDRKGSR